MEFAMSAFITLPDGSVYQGNSRNLHKKFGAKWLFQFHTDITTPEAYHPEWKGQEVTVRWEDEHKDRKAVIICLNSVTRKDDGYFEILVEPL